MQTLCSRRVRLWCDSHERGEKIGALHANSLFTPRASLRVRQPRAGRENRRVPRMKTPLRVVQSSYMYSHHSPGASLLRAAFRQTCSFCRKSNKSNNSDALHRCVPARYIALALTPLISGANSRATEHAPALNDSNSDPGTAGPEPPARSQDEDSTMQLLRERHLLERATQPASNNNTCTNHHPTP